MKLIPNNITVSEQLGLRRKITNYILEWSGSKLPRDIDLNKLEIETGIRCRCIITDLNKIGTLIDFECLDEKMYTYFLLKWS